MRPTDRLRAFGECVARAMGLDPAGVGATVSPLALRGFPPRVARVWLACQGDTYVGRKGFCAVGDGATDEAAVDAAIAALSARLATRAREAADDARRAVEVSEWWERVAQEVTRG